MFPTPGPGRTRAQGGECSSLSYLPPSPTFSPPRSFDSPYHWTSFSPPQNFSLARFDSPTYDGFSFSGDNDPFASLAPSPFLYDHPLEPPFAAGSTFSMSSLPQDADGASYGGTGTSYGGSSDFSSMTRHSSASSRASSDARLGSSGSGGGGDAGYGDEGLEPFTPQSEADCFSADGAYRATSRGMLDEGMEAPAAGGGGGGAGYRCLGCGWSTASEDLIRRHYHSHSAGEPFECFEARCGAIVPHPVDFLEHSAREHGKRARDEDHDARGGGEGHRPSPKRLRTTLGEAPTLPATPELTPDQGVAHRGDAMDAFPRSSDMLVSRTLSYGALERPSHPTHPARSLSLGGPGAMERLESSSIIYSSAPLFKSRPSYCAEPGSAHPLYATPRSRPTSSSTSASPSPMRPSYSLSTRVQTPPHGVALRRSDSAPINAVFRPPSHEHFYSAPAAHPLHYRQHPLSPVSPTPTNVGFAHRKSVQRDQGGMEAVREDHHHEGFHPIHQTRTPPSQTLPLSPSSPPHSSSSSSLIYAQGSTVGFTPSQAALLSAQGMNRLLSVLPPPSPLAASFDSRPAPGFHPPPPSPQYMVTYRAPAPPAPPPPPPVMFAPHVPSKSHYAQPAKSHHAQPAKAHHAQPARPVPVPIASYPRPTPPSPTSPSSSTASSFSPPRRSSTTAAAAGSGPPSRGGNSKGHFCPEPTCRKAFKRLEHLRRHEKTHTSDKPFGCDWEGCGRYFSRNDNLAQHKKTHEKIGGRNGLPASGKPVKQGMAA